MSYVALRSFLILKSFLLKARHKQTAQKIGFIKSDKITDVTLDYIYWGLETARF